MLGHAIASIENLALAHFMFLLTLSEAKVIKIFVVLRIQQST